MTDQPYDEREDEREAQYAAIHEEEPEDPLLDELEDPAARARATSRF
jgi:hypothetical protein